MAMMSGPIAGASISFRGDETFNPKLSPSGIHVAFERTNTGLARVSRSIFGDGVAYGTSNVGSSVGAVGGIGNAAEVAWTQNGVTPFVSSSPGALPLTDPFGIATFDSGRALDVDFDKSRIVGSVMIDNPFPIIDENSLAIWTFNQITFVYDLTNHIGISFGFQGGILAVTPDGLFGVGLSSSSAASGTFDAQAFLINLTTNAITALPFLPATPINDASANALSDSTSLIAGTTDTTSSTSVATAWTDSGGVDSITELPRFAGETVSSGLAVAGDGLSIGGSIGPQAAVWNGITFEARSVEAYALGAGLTIPPECELSSVTDMDGSGFRIVGDATCDTGGGPFKRVYELELPFAVPEPDLSLSLAIGVLAVTSRRRAHRAPRAI